MPPRVFDHRPTWEGNRGAGDKAEPKKPASEPTFSRGNLAWAPGCSEREASSGLPGARLLPGCERWRACRGRVVQCPSPVCPSPSPRPSPFTPLPLAGPEMGSTGRG
jgi:hypothetical protein